MRARTTNRKNIRAASQQVDSARVLERARALYLKTPRPGLTFVGCFPVRLALVAQGALVIKVWSDVRSSSSSGLKGHPFPNLLYDDAEREKFNRFISTRTVPIEQDENYDGDAKSIYTCLRDGNGTVVPVQLFHSCHHDPPDAICNIVGVREVEERGSIEELGQARPTRAVQPSAESSTEEPSGPPMPSSSETRSVVNYRPRIVFRADAYITRAQGDVRGVEMGLATSRKFDALCVMVLQDVAPVSPGVAAEHQHRTTGRVEEGPEPQPIGIFL